jgi:hypothetical protein
MFTLLHKCRKLKFIHMAKTNMIPGRLTERPQLIAFSWSAENAGIIMPWLNVNGEWMQQADLPVGVPIAISVENDLLTIKQCADGNTGH